MVKRLRHHPFTVVTGVRFPLESPKYGRCTRPYFFGESHPCYAYCFAIRDRLHAIAPSHFVPRRPLSAIAVRRFPLESPKYGRCTRPYFFGESHPCFAYCFAIRDRLFLFRARFAARHVSRLGRFFCVLSHLMSLAYQKGKLRSIRRKIFAKSLARYFMFRLNVLTFYATFHCG